MSIELKGTTICAVKKDGKIAIAGGVDEIRGGIGFHPGGIDHRHRFYHAVFHLGLGNLGMEEQFHPGGKQHPVEHQLQAFLHEMLIIPHEAQLFHFCHDLPKNPAGEPDSFLRFGIGGPIAHKGEYQALGRRAAQAIALIQ